MFIFDHLVDIRDEPARLCRNAYVGLFLGNFMSYKLEILPKIVFRF